MIICLFLNFNVLVYVRMLWEQFPTDTINKHCSKSWAKFSYKGRVTLWNMHWPQQTSALCRHTLPQNSDTCRLNWPGQCQNHDGANRTNNAEQTYRVVKEERSIVLEVKVSVIERSNSLYTCLNLSGYRHRAVWIYREIFFCLRAWTNRETYKRTVDTPYEYLARVLDAAASINKFEDQLGRSTLDLRTQVTECT